MKHQHGFTLTEILLSIAIIGIGVGVAVPYYSDFLAETSSQSYFDKFHNALTFARDRAIKKRRNVALCPRDTMALTCAKAAWSNGWLIFDDLNANGTLEPTDTILTQEPPLPAKITLNSQSGSSFDDVVVFAKSGRSINPVTNAFMPGAFVLCDNRGINKGRFIVISVTGRTSRMQVTSASMASTGISNCNG